MFRISTKLPFIIHSRCQNWGKKVFQRTQVYKVLRWALRKRSKEKRANQRMPDSSCMGDESRIQNVPSLADVKSRKMAHYWDRKGARWSNRPHVGLKQNGKGRGRGRWHRNILIFQLLLNLDFDRITQIRKKGVEKEISFLNNLHSHCIKLAFQIMVYEGRATVWLTHFLQCTWG